MKQLTLMAITALSLFVSTAAVAQVKQVRRFREVNGVLSYTTTDNSTGTATSVSSGGTSSTATSTQLTMATLRAQNSQLVPLLPTMIQITDAGKEGLFKYDPADNSTADNGATCIVVSGRRYKRPILNGEVLDSWFGVIPNDGLDDRPGLDLAEAFCVATGYLKLRLSPGTIDTFSLWDVRNGNDFIDITIEGSAGGFFDLSPTTIVAHHTNAPAINVQGGRAVNLINFTVRGQNTKPLSITTVFSKNAADYVTTGLPNGRYNPYCGISTDAYTGGKPTGGYDVGTYGGKVGAARLVGVTIEQFVVGLAINPSGNVGGGDNGGCKDVQIRACETAVSIGTGQAREWKYEGFCSIGNVHTAFSTQKNGDQNGSPPHVVGVDGYGYRLHDYNVSIGSFTFLASHFESFGCLGIADGNINNAIGGTYINCHFNSKVSSQVGDNVASVFLHTGGSTVKFQGGFISTDYGLESGSLAIANLFNMIAPDANILFENFGLFSADATGRRLIGYSSGDHVKIQAQGVISRNSELNGSPRLNRNNYNYPEARQELHPSAQTWRYGNQTWRIKYAMAKWSHGLSSDFPASNWVYTGTGRNSTLTFTSSSASTFIVGDYLYLMPFRPGTTTRASALVPGAIVTGIAGSTVTAKILSSEIDPSYTSGTIAIAVVPVLYGSRGMTVQTVGGSAVAMVTVMNGSAATSGNVATYLRVGDWLLGGNLNSGNTRITAINSTSITLSETIGGSGTSVVGSASLIDEDSYATTAQLSSAGYITANQTNTFTFAQYVMSYFGINTTNTNDNSATYKGAIKLNNNNNEEGGLLISSLQNSVTGARALLGLVGYQTTDSQNGSTGQKSHIYSYAYSDVGLSNSQGTNGGAHNFIVEAMVPSLNHVNQNLHYRTVTRGASTAGSNVNSQSYFYVQGNSGTPASFFSAKGYYSWGQFAGSNSSITTHTDFHAASFSGTGTMGTRHGLLIDYDITGITTPRGLWQTVPGVANQMAGYLQQGWRTSATAPTISDIPAGQAVLWKNTGDGTLKYYANDGGTLKSIIFN